MKNITTTVQSSRLIPAVNCLNLLIEKMRPGKMNMVCSLIAEEAVPKALKLQHQMDGIRKLHVETDADGNLKTTTIDGVHQYVVKDGHVEEFNKAMTDLLEDEIEIRIPHLDVDDFDKIESAYTGDEPMSLAPLVVFIAPEAPVKVEK